MSAARPPRSPVPAHRPATPPPDAAQARRALGAVLRALRKAHPDAPTVERLAEWADLHRNYVGSAERGERNVAFVALTRWLAALGVSWAEFGIAVDRRLARDAGDPTAEVPGT